eukprot:1160898-Pelagomonas_calceolata.AAC.7
MLYSFILAIRCALSEGLWHICSLTSPLLTCGDFSPAHPFLQHQLSVQAVSNLLLQHDKKLFYFMSELLALLLAGMDQPQTEADQPNSLALGTYLLQLSCPCRQVQLCNPIPNGSKLMRLTVFLPNSWIIFVWLEQLSRPSSQTTWLKVKILRNHHNHLHFSALACGVAIE